MLIGRLGADPEVRYMPSGETVTNINLATSQRWKDKQTGEQKEKTEWHRVTFFNVGNYKLAEIAGEYLKKGTQCYIEGRIQTRKWQDKNTGQDRYTTEIIAEQMNMLGSRSDGTANFGDNQQAGYAAPAAAPQATAPQQPAYQQPQAAPQFNQAPAPQQAYTPPVAPVQQAPVQPPQQGFNQAPAPVQQPQQGFTPPAAPQAPVQPPVQQPFSQPAQAPVQQPYQAPANNQPQQPAAAPSDDYEDDIPF